MPTLEHSTFPKRIIFLNNMTRVIKKALKKILKCAARYWLFKKKKRISQCAITLNKHKIA